MLVLQRKEQEEVEIECRGVTITLKVLSIGRRGRKEVSIGFAAPPEVKIARTELLFKPDPKETP